MIPFISFLENTICTLYCLVYDMVYKESSENITIHDGYVKVPYVHNERLYYIIVPISPTKHQKDALHTYHNPTGTANKTGRHHSIYYNNIIESVLKISGTKDEIDISQVLERYMGPDQCYKEQKKLLRVRDILPETYHESFQYVRLLYDNLESVMRTDLDDDLFGPE